MKLNFKRFAKNCIRLMRAIAVMLVFVVDVKVKAEISVSKVEDDADIEVGGKVVSLKGLKKISSKNVEIETSLKGRVKFDLGNHQVVLMSRTFYGISNEAKTIMYRGSALFRTSTKKSETLTIRTPHGVVFTKGSEFFILVDQERTRVGVIEGKVSIYDRVTDKENSLEAGFAFSIGGLRADGFRQIGGVEPINFELAKVFLELGELKKGEKLAAQVEELEGKWKYAVSVVSLRQQKEINSEIQELNKIEQRYLAKKNAEKNERDAIRRHMRAKIMGLDPESLDSRSPASEH